MNKHKIDALKQLCKRAEREAFFQEHFASKHIQLECASLFVEIRKAVTLGGACFTPSNQME